MKPPLNSSSPAATIAIGTLTSATEINNKEPSMPEKYISFNYNWQSADVDIDLNRHSVRAHLAALIRGYGSSTESLVVDFVNGTFRFISQYDSVQAAWQRLDSRQQGFVEAFRSLTTQPHLDVRAPDFPQTWFRSVVAAKFRQLRDQAEIDQRVEKLPIEAQAALAEQAERLIRTEVTAGPEKAWTIRVYDDE